MYFFNPDDFAKLFFLEQQLVKRQKLSVKSQQVRLVEALLHLFPNVELTLRFF